LKAVIKTIESVLSDKLLTNSRGIDINSSMKNTPEWDSLDFINIFLSINKNFGIDADHDDAVHYDSVAKIVEFVEKKLG